MRLKSVKIANVPPISLFEIENLSDIVVIAGRNGVGKTRLVQTLVEEFRNLRSGKAQLIVEATCAEERSAWAKDLLDTSVPQDAQRLQNTLRQSRRRSHWRSSVVQFESNRAITQIAPFTFTWDYSDPFEEMVGWEHTLSGLTQRFNDMIHAIFRKFRSHREAIAKAADEAWRRGDKTMPLDFQDPLLPFKSAFSQLLGPKELVDVDPQRQTLEYIVSSFDSTRLPITSLSSGEREVLNIVFDFILRNPEDCVVIFDEPELHLHPELSYKLIQTLRSVGARNQFVFCTHSPDIITASLDQSVVFVAPPAGGRPNQAVLVVEQDETNQALKLLGQSVGIIALGKKLVLIEGTASSLDKQAYGSILQNRFADLVLVPAGGKGLISSFALLVQEVLEKTLWGVEFFMLCDRDVVPPTLSHEELERSAHGRLRVIPRYHLENYFLEASVLARVFENLEPSGSPLRDPDLVEETLRELGRTMTPYAAALTVAAHFRTVVGNVDILPKGVHAMTIDQAREALVGRAADEAQRVGRGLASREIHDLTTRVHDELIRSLDSGSSAWKSNIPGRPLLHRFAAAARIQPGRLKQAYIAEAGRAQFSPFEELIDIFRGFSSAAPPSA